MLKKKLTFKNLKAFILYFLIACVGFSIDFGIFLLLTQNSFNIIVANLLAFFFGSTINLALIRTILLPNTKFNLLVDWFLTLPINGIVVFFGTALIFILHEIMYINLIIAKLTSTVLTLCVNYALRIKYFTAK